MVRTQERSQSRRRRLLDAALMVFTERGYNDAAIDDIARASETSKGGLYFHFPSKQALFLALLDEAGDALFERVHAAMARETDPLLKGEAALREALRVFGEHRLLARLLFVDALGAGKPFVVRLDALHAEFEALIAACLDEAVAGGQIAPLDTRIAARAWFGAVNHVVMRWVQTGQPNQLEDAFSTLRQLLIHGVVYRRGEL